MRVLCYSCAFSLAPIRSVPLSDPAAIPDTPRGRGSQPPQKEEKAKQEESLHLFDLLPAPQAVWGGPDRHSGQYRLRGPKLWDSTLTRVPTKPLDSTKLTSTEKNPTSAFTAPLIKLMHFSKFIGVWGAAKTSGSTTRGCGSYLKTRTMAFSELLDSEEFHLKMLWKYIMYINSKTREISFLQQ